MERLGPLPDTNYRIPCVNCDIPKGYKYEDGWGELPMNDKNEQKYYFDSDSDFMDVFFCEYNDMKEKLEEPKVSVNELVQNKSVKRRKI